MRQEYPPSTDSSSRLPLNDFGLMTDSSAKKLRICFNDINSKSRSTCTGDEGFLNMIQA